MGFWPPQGVLETHGTRPGVEEANPHPARVIQLRSARDVEALLTPYTGQP